MKQQAIELVEGFAKTMDETMYGSPYVQTKSKEIAIIHLKKVIEAFMDIEHQLDPDNYHFIMKKHNQLIKEVEGL